MKTVEQDRIELIEKRLDRILMIMGENPEGMSMAWKLERIEILSTKLMTIKNPMEIKLRDAGAVK